MPRWVIDGLRSAGSAMQEQAAGRASLSATWHARLRQRKMLRLFSPVELSRASAAEGSFLRSLRLTARVSRDAAIILVITIAGPSARLPQVRRRRPMRRAESRLFADMAAA